MKYALSGEIDVDNLVNALRILSALAEIAAENHGTIDEFAIYEDTPYPKKIMVLAPTGEVQIVEK